MPKQEEEKSLLRRKRSRNKFLKTELLALERQGQFENWLAGNGERTEEEEAIAHEFRGPYADSMAKEAIAIHRRSQMLASLSGEGELSESEKAIKGSFRSSHAELFGRRSVEIGRLARLKRYLNGDSEEDLDV